ncbi:hypothetical protein [uncultured Eubacterium sp.]|uniref:hypothetical protein n=1 Tax=uncultured Eubacterium sp. TaxID=165185 RepID=UPI0025E567EF|nr:hypothetical protein [uncultured Eubacterium sp.]
MKTTQNAINCTREEAIKIGGHICVSQVKELNDAFAKFNNEHLIETNDYCTSLLLQYRIYLQWDMLAGFGQKEAKKQKRKIDLKQAKILFGSTR